MQVRAQVRSLAGACRFLSFDLDGTRVGTSASTEFVGGSCNQVQNRVTLEVHGRVTAAA